MRGAFVFACRLSSGSPPLEARERYDLGAMRLGLDRPRWMETEGAMAGLLRSADDGQGAVGLVRTRRLVVVGSARLDNPDEISARIEPAGPAECSDLALVAAALEARGDGCIPKLLGEFAFVAWEPATRRLIAARDALGGRALYYSVAGDSIVVSSRAALLATDDYDPEFLADYLAGAIGPPQRTAFHGVSSVAPGTWQTWQGGRAETTAYWSPVDFTIDPTPRGPEQYEAFRDLLDRAIRLRISTPEKTWAQLSGGLDSSSIVALALRNCGARPGQRALAGAVTFTDSLEPDGPDRYISELLANSPLPYIRIPDTAPLEEDGCEPPLTDRPALQALFVARDRRMVEVVRRAGGSVLLSGFGADHYLAGNLYFFADMVARGEVGSAVDGLLHWAERGRVSFWKLARENVLFPLTPAALRVHLPTHRPSVPSWVDSAFAKRYELKRRTPLAHAVDGRPGEKYVSAVAHNFLEIGASIDTNFVSQHVDVRYPFLYRPLVEFSLRLPPEERTQPFARKWVLRQAMRGILPEAIRTRTTKDGMGSRIAWWFSDAGGQIEAFARDSVLAELGCVDPQRFREAIAAARRDHQLIGRLLLTLSLEAWLRARHHRWPVSALTRTTVSAA